VTAIDLRGKLITLEGLDFTGKSSVARRLSQDIERAGFDLVVTEEPGGTPVGRRARQLVLDPGHPEMHPLAELLLYMVSRTQHTHEVILPALAAGKTVLTSRYRLSSMAYQGFGRGLPLDLIEQLNEAATQGHRADLTFLIDVPVAVALSRKRGRGDRIESETVAFYERVRAGYLELTAEDPSVHHIDGTQSIDGVADEILKHLGLPNAA